MIYKNGNLIENGVTIPIFASASALLAAVDQNFGSYDFIDLTTGESKKDGLVDGSEYPISVVSGFTGLDTTIMALPDYISALAKATDIATISKITDLDSAIAYAVSKNASVTVGLKNGISAHIVAPVPPIFVAGMFVDVSLPIPPSTQLLTTRCQVFDAVGNLYNESSTNIELTHVSGAPTIRITSVSTPWVAGGYIAVTYKE